MVNDVMNEQYIKKPHLPTADVTLVVMSARKPLLIEALKKLHIRIIPTEPLPMIRGEERYHADMSFCHIGNSEIVVADSLSEDTFRKLTQEGFHCQKSFEAITGEKSLLNVCLLGKQALCHTKYADQALLQLLAKHGVTILHTNQRYTKCSSAVIAENALITADESVYRVCKQHQIDVLKIRSGHIGLSGYDYGFIGGCCGMISRDMLAFSGEIRQHPDYDIISAFAKNYGVRLLSLSKEPLYDIGGILPLKEENRTSGV